MPIGIWLSTLLPTHVEHAMSVEELPSPMLLAGSVLFCMLCEDFTFYFSHRLLHTRFLYRHFHKMHHRFTVTVGIAAEYAHPFEHVFGIMLPTAIGPLILGRNIHILTVFAWYAVRTGESLDGHCGYDFSFSPYRLIPFSS